MSQHLGSTSMAAAADTHPKPEELPVYGPHLPPLPQGTPGQPAGPKLEAATGWWGLAEDACGWQPHPQLAHQALPNGHYLQPPAGDASAYAAAYAASMYHSVQVPYYGCPMPPGAPYMPQYPPSAGFGAYSPPTAKDAWGYGYAAGLTRQHTMTWAHQAPTQHVPCPGLPMLAPSRGLPAPPPPAAPPKTKLAGFILPAVLGVKRNFEPGCGGPTRAGFPPRQVPVYIAINKRIASARTAKDILDVVTESGQDFDTVCMATAVHRMAKMDAGSTHYEHIAAQPEFERLLRMIEGKLHEFPARNLANVLWALAKMELRVSPRLLDSLAAVALLKISEFNPQNLANSLWVRLTACDVMEAGFATLGAEIMWLAAYCVKEHNPGKDLLEALAGAAEDKVNAFTSQNISNLVLSYAKLGHHPGAVMAAVSAAACNKIAEFTPQALSNTVWAFSKLGQEDTALLEAVAVASVPQLSQFNAQNLANLAWAYANLMFEPPCQLLDHVATAAQRSITKFSPQNTSNLIWAFARLGHAPADLLSAASAHAGAHLPDYQPQSIANLIWAYATLDRHPGHTFVAALLLRASDILQFFSAQNISNTVWCALWRGEERAVATLKDTGSKDFCAAIARETVLRLGSTASAADFSRQHLSNTIRFQTSPKGGLLCEHFVESRWAFATLEQQPGNAMVHAVAKAMVTRVCDCNPQELSNTVWSFAKLGQYNEQLMNAIAAEATPRIQEFSQQNLSNLCWAFGKLGHFDGKLMAAIAERSIVLIKELALQHLTNITWSYACLGLVVPSLMGVLLAEIQHQLATEAFNAQQLSNLLWALTILRLCTPEMWKALLEHFGRLRQEDGSIDLPPEALTQVHQAKLLMELEAGRTDGGLHPTAAPAGLLDAAAALWGRTVRRVHISEFHADVAAQLRAMGIPHTLEHATEDAQFSIDIALPQERIAVEVDGPHHFTANTHTPLGETAGRRRLLAARGWTVVSIPYFLWDSSPSLPAKQDYIAQAIAAARQQQAARRVDPSIPPTTITITNFPRIGG